MNQLQKRLYQLLLELDEACSENGISYFLSAGCALGAIRQGKFIYWDDDIDIFLTRDNWEKLRAVLEENCPDNRKLIHKDNASYYGNTIARYVDLDTLAFRKSMMLCPEAMCVAVEIFILDPFPTEENAQKEHIDNLKLYSELLNPFMILNSGNTETEFGFDIEQYKVYRQRIGEQGEANVLTELEEKITNISDAECDTYCMRWGRIPYLFTKKLMGSGRKELFEGHEFPVMQFAEQSFRTGYGNGWMYLPEETDAGAHNDIVDLNFDNGERYSLSEEQKQKLQTEYIKRKTINIDKMQIERARDKVFANVQASILSRKLREENNEKTLIDFLRGGNYEELNQVFSEYYELIHDSRFKGHGVHIALSDGLFYTAMMNLIMQGKYYIIPAYLSDAFDRTSTESYKQELCARYDFCRRLSIAIYDERDSKKAWEILETNKQYDDMLDYHRGRLWAMIQSARQAEDYTAVIEQADMSMMRFGEDGEILCYKAEAMHQNGNPGGAEDLFEQGVRRTRNGFLLRRAEELCGVEIPANIIKGDRTQYTPAGCLLIAFHKFCEKNQLRYYLTGKTKDEDITLSRDHHFEVAMSHDDILKLEAAMKACGEKGDLQYSLEPVNGSFVELSGMLRIYSNKTCVADIRSHTKQADHRAYITIQEIERNGERRNRELFDIMRSVWIKQDSGKFTKKRRKLRTASKCAALAGAAFPKKTKENILREYRRRHFVISNEELKRKHYRLRIGLNIIESAALSEADCISLGPINALVLRECTKRTQDAPLHAKRELRYQILDTKREYSEIVTDSVELDLMRCCSFQKDIDKMNKTIAAETKNIKASWKKLKEQISNQVG